MENELVGIYTLMQMAEDRFAALKQVTGELSTERAALAKERTRLEKTLTDQAQGLKMAAASLKAVGVAIRQDATQITPALQEAVQEAVGDALGKTLSLTSTHVQKTLETASEPILERLSGVTQAASAAEATLKNAGRWFAWKWVAVAGGSVIGILLTAVLTLKLLEQSHWRSLQAQQENLLHTIAPAASHSGGPRKTHLRPVPGHWQRWRVPRHAQRHPDHPVQGRAVYSATRRDKISQTPGRTTHAPQRTDQ